MSATQDKKFDKPLDTWIEEEHYGLEVQKNGSVKEDRSVVKKYKTMYTRPTLNQICAPGEHYFVLEDPHERSVKCINCPYGTWIHAGKQTLKNGKIINLS